MRRVSFCRWLWTVLAPLALAGCQSSSAPTSSERAGPPESRRTDGAPADRSEPMRFAITDLGPLMPSDSGEGDTIALNDRGQAAFRTKTLNGQWRVCLWENGALTELKGLEGEGSEAYALSNEGKVVGAADQKEGMRRGFLYESGRTILFPADPDRGGQAFGISRHGEVVGAEMGADGGTQAFIWKAGRTILLKPGGRSSVAYAINDAGRVVGTLYDAEGRGRAFVWEKGRTTLLTGLDGERGGSAHAVDASGVIVGRADTKEKDSEGNRIHRAVMWRDGQATDLGALPKYPFSVAYAINGGGWIVGAAIETPADMPPTDSRAILCQNGRLYDLNTLIPADSGWTLYDAKGINSGGMIVGTGRRRGTSELRAYLLTPKP